MRRMEMLERIDIFGLRESEARFLQSGVDAIAIDLEDINGFSFSRFEAVAVFDVEASLIAEVQEVSESPGLIRHINGVHLGDGCAETRCVQHLSHRFGFIAEDARDPEILGISQEHGMHVGAILRDRAREVRELSLLILKEDGQL